MWVMSCHIGEEWIGERCELSNRALLDNDNDVDGGGGSGGDFEIECGSS